MRTYLPRGFDFLLTLGVTLLAGLNLLVVASSKPAIFSADIAWYGTAFLTIIVVGLFDLRTFVNYRWLIAAFYFVSLSLLLFALFFSPVVRNTHSWIVLGPLRFQPSELAKVALIVLSAYFFARRHHRIAHLDTMLVSFTYFAIPAGIIFLQPDWGSALVVLGLWAGFLLVSGLRLTHLILGILILAILGGIAWGFLLAPYQKARIVGFVNPTYDPLGVNYSVIQAKIAIGSGGLFGKGFRQGTQTQLGFLTEPATDFAFAALIEEWGFVGGFLALLGFVLVVGRTIMIGLGSQDVFSQFVCLGTATLFLLEFALNVGSNLGLMPVVGVTFPLFSYGGSSLLTKAMLVGMIQSIASRSRF
jgi:rod shape determining protein RodA